MTQNNLQLTKQEIETIIEVCYKDTKEFCRTLLPDSFYAPFSPLHDQIFEAIDNPSPRVVIAAPRGLGKTTIARAVAAKGILYRDVNFISYVSNSSTAAEMQTENIKRELVSNQIVKYLFGDIKISDRPEGLDESFSKMAWVAYGNTLIMPRGAGQQVRGLIWGTVRPQLIIVDDLEDTEEIRNESNRIKLKDWFFGDLMKSINRYKMDWKVIYIDTLKHEDALLNVLLESKDWHSIKLSICDDNYKSNAPEYISDEELAKEVESHREKGLLDVFYREYMNLPISTEDAVFKQEYFKYFEPSELQQKVNDRKIELENIVIVDPAKTVKLHSAESAVVGVGLDMHGASIYVRDIVAKKMHPDELYEEIFRMAARLQARVVGIEVTSLNEFITQPIKNEMFRRGQFFELVELKARAKKEDRISFLAPYYRQGFVYHNQTCCAGLEAQLLMFPRSKRFDIMDALAYVIEMMELGTRYFEPPENDDFSPEDEFKEIEYEKPLEGWRHA